MQTGLDLKIIDILTGGRIGTFDVACPLCGPQRRKPTNQRRHVLRVWRIDIGYAGFHCARCGERGYARNGESSRFDLVELEHAKAERPTANASRRRSDCRRPAGFGRSADPSPARLARRIYVRPAAIRAHCRQRWGFWRREVITARR